MGYEPRLIWNYPDHRRSRTERNLPMLSFADVSQRRTPNKEIVSRIEFAFIRIFRKYRSKGGDAVYAIS